MKRIKNRIRLITIIFLVATSGHLAYAKYQTQQAVVPEQVIEEATRIVKRGQASWYSKRDKGIKKHTANMEVFDDQDLTCAMWDVPFNQRIKVTNLENGKSIIVRVNDRGPHKRLVRRGRVIDLTKAAFAEIASLKKGLIDIELEFL